MIDNKAFYKLSYGLYVVSSIASGRKNGQIANTVFQITSDPLTVAVSINKSNLTHEYIQRSRLIGVSALSEKTPIPFIGRFGFKSGRDTDKFDGVDFKMGESGVPIVLENTTSYFELQVEKEVDTSTHTIFICKVLNAEVIDDSNAMTYKYYQEVKQGRVSRPSVESDVKTSDGKSKYMCQICGYIYNPAVGDETSGIAAGTAFEDLPSNWQCPVCKVSKDEFKKID